MPFFFFFNDTATTEIYTLSLHDALPISSGRSRRRPVTKARSGPSCPAPTTTTATTAQSRCATGDRKSTRLNSSHSQISYAVFCLKKKKFHISHESSVDLCEVILLARAD